MSKTPRFHKATALLPLALLSVAWTATITGVGGTTNVAADLPDPVLPDGTSVPAEAIEAPASVSLPDAVSPAVPDGSAAEQVVATATPSGIPAAALAAYQRAATVINAADRSCRLPWEVVAAIGRVESDHGRFGGSVLDSDGVATPGIIGIALDGRRGTTKISDTDGGVLDGDTRFDRAVGPMQFIPSTWRTVGVDADGDGERNPQDVDDAALATAVYLCAGDVDMETNSGQRSAVYRYNHSDDYVDLVLSIAAAYAEGDFTSVPNNVVSAGETLYADDPVETAPTAPVRPTKPREQAAEPQPSAPQPSDDASPDSPSSPQPTSPAQPSPSSDPTKGGLPPVVKDPGSVVTDPGKAVGDTLTWAQARVECLAKGISVLDLTALTTCITDILAPDGR